MLAAIVAQMSHREAWLIVRDLNEVLNSDEKWGGRCVGSSSRNFLENFMIETDFTDLGFKENKYTWRNNRYGNQHIRQRLDRAIANEKWRFPNAGVIHLPTSDSDHNPILVKMWQTAERKPIPFRFEFGWTRDSSCKNVIKEAWNESVKGSSQYRFTKKIKKTKTALKLWNKNVFKNCDTQIYSLMEKIDIIQQQVASIENRQIEVELQIKLQEYLKRKDMI